MMATVQRYFVIGDPIEHSLSPAIYTQLFSIYDIEAECGAKRVTPDTLTNFIASIPDENIRGFNITMPLKQDVEAFLTWKDPDARFGVNTVCVRPEGLYGYSTDAAGFRISLNQHGRSYERSRVVFIGCGGAGRALIYDALAHGAAHVTIVNRTPAKARQFAGDSRVQIVPFEDLGRACAQCDLLVNTTPLGMHGVSARFQSLDFMQDLPAGAFVCDLIYKPLATDFLAAARATGHDTMNGLGMLIWQAMLAFEKYTGIMPTAETANAVKQHLLDGLRDC